jgi:hypothetical protein
MSADPTRASPLRRYRLAALMLAAALLVALGAWAAERAWRAATTENVLDGAKILPDDPSKPHERAAEGVEQPPAN